MAMEPKQASLMSKMDRTGHFGPAYLLQVSKNDDEEHCFFKK